LKKLPSFSEPLDKETVEIDVSRLDLLKLLGNQDSNLRLVARAYGVKGVVRGNRLILRGPTEEVKLAAGVMERLVRMVRAGESPGYRDVQLMLDYTGESERYLPEDFAEDVVYYPPQRHPITPKGPGQLEYVRALRDFDIVFAIGPAGTGKTFLAVAMAVAALKREEVSRIVLVRPAVEAGENLGFLPGDMKEKVDPYLKPLYDALNEMVSPAKLKRYLEMGTIEIAPLAYMRGRTLNNAFIILDEAQNTTSKQMKMFLTRIGFNSKAVITGDITQVDLPSRVSSGLIQSQEILAGIPGIRFVYLGEQDVVRHSLVRKIIQAYQVYEDKQDGGDEEGNGKPGGNDREE